MTPESPLRDMADVRALLAAADPDSRLVPCELRDIRRGSGAISTVTDSVAEMLSARAHSADGTVVLLVDETPISREGADLKDLVEGRLRERFQVTRKVLSDGHQELHVSEPVVDAATRAVAGADAVVAVGGGTINDIAKLAAAASDVPVLVAVQTAASVDGYTDNVSVLLRGGVKRTVPSRWPDIVIADAETIATAPASMNRAGYGEMTSMFTAPADWRLANLMGADPTFSRGPIQLLVAVGRELHSWSPGVGRGETAALEQLTWALAVRGIATGVSGGTACLSGVEHLVSHMLDLYHGDRGLQIGLHGAQVGVASVVAAAAWEHLTERLAASGGARVEAAAFDRAAARVRIETAFGGMRRSSGITAECWADYAKKLATCSAELERINTMLSRWPEHEPELRQLVRPSAGIAAGLRAAGAAAAFDELTPLIEPELARWAVENCALMRNRVTVVDLLTFLGWWQAEDVTAVLSRAEQAVAGASSPAEVSHVG